MIKEICTSAGKMIFVGENWFTLDKMVEVLSINETDFSNEYWAIIENGYIKIKNPSYVRYLND